MSLCQDLQAKIQLLKTLKQQFEQFYRTLPPGSNRDQAKREILDKISPYRDEIESVLFELKELLFKYEFTAPNAINPYAEAMKEGGITNPDLIAEKQDLTINLQELLTGDREAYEKAKISEWVNDLPENIADLNLTNEQIEAIKQRVEKGEILIVMPGRQAQIAGLSQVILKLKPVWIKDGKEEPVKEAYHWDYLDNLIGLMNEIAQNPGLTPKKQQEIEAKIQALLKDKYSPSSSKMIFDAVNAIPEHPYVALISPTQSPEAETKNLNLNDQIARFKEIKASIQKQNPDLNPAITSIAEYLALQNRFTARAKALAESQGGKKLKNLSPLDDYYRTGGTFSRFIDLPVSADGSVPLGGWSAGSSQVFLSGGDVGADDYGGFRFSVRV